ncbi:uncharacterized protein IL334_005735 [Kwoniella shivajii]|uniref:HIT-type domain-containing protein n=1 Tax=Kwoniella shivajii TaxID=564305 RepID=A0ABZ1D3Y7_9TREE|nr:hypothetical protein IL334_005735 [Kwoniella shivajii]
MPPAVRKQPSRNTLPTPTAGSSQTLSQSATTSLQRQRHNDSLTDFQARRLARRLDELERTNPTDIPASSFIPSNLHSNTDHTQSNLNSPLGNTGQGQGLGQGKKKQSSNVRRILYNKKGLKGWLDELPQEPAPPYVIAASVAPTTPARKLCSSCGYIGNYKCQRCAEWSCTLPCMEIHERDGGCGIGG